MSPKPCMRCRLKPVAWTEPRIDVCYDCLPGGPFPPPPCRRCGSVVGYYSTGLCERCHHMAPQRVDSCRHCLGWGVIRKYKWLCWGCVNWRTKNEYGTCRSCQRRVPIAPDGYCRLCWRQHVMMGGRRGSMTVLEANKHGQQLFLANLFSTPDKQRVPGGRRNLPKPPAPTPPRRVYRRPGYEQLPLLYVPHDFIAGREHGFPQPRDSELVAYFSQELAEHATAHGWSPSTAKKARRGLQKLLSLQETPGAKIKKSTLRELVKLDLTVVRVQDFLTRYDLVDDDLTPAIETWFRGKTKDLPEQMARELRTWFDVLLKGHTQPPRSRPRSQSTIRSRLNAALPCLQHWAYHDGYESLREVTRRDFMDALPRLPEGPHRFLTASALRSIFKTLKAHKVIFRNPTLHVPLGANYYRIPMPADIDVIRLGLNSLDPATAALTALLAFHALRSGQLRALQLIDIRDGYLHMGDRTVPLAEPVRARLAAYLNYRNNRWPASKNPHLFIHIRSALGTKPVGGRWIGLHLGLAARDIRTDRILDEVRATGGDIRRICDLFGLTIDGATPYVATLNHLDLDDPAKTGR